ncbi:MAG: hypothetical protein CM1200mP24_02090 [Gammaproteobacteria bacterium]|nr:MAG: hypothetical protein CM1200mP24_02090 [Gammaproteobacteria bacterium]
MAVVTYVVFSTGYENRSEYGTGGIDAFFAQRRNIFSPAHYRMFLDVIAFIGVRGMISKPVRYKEV